MQVPVGFLAHPGQNTAYGIFAVAASMYAFAYSALGLGPILILLFYGVWFGLLLLDQRILLDGFGRLWWVLLVPAVALLSTAWSDTPGITLRSGVQFLITIGCAIIASRVLDLRTLVKGILVGSMVVLAYSYLNGRYTFDVLEQIWIYSGAFASKNQLGLYASIAVLFGVLGILVLRFRGRWMLIAGISIAMGVQSLLVSFSATSALSILAVVGFVVLARMGLSLGLRLRRTVGLIGLVGVAGAVAAVLNFPIVEMVLRSLGRSPTLTGRTDLWQVGLDTFAANPLLGIGYQSFWTIGNPQAEELWAIFYIPARSGFHFHNVWVQSLAELGIVGCAAFVILLAGTILVLVKDYFTGVDEKGAFALLSILLLLTIRSFAELDFYGAHSIGAFLLFFSAGVAAKAVVRDAPPQARHEGNPLGLAGLSSP
jgi:exopolysaccharide production protein ExoQ